MHTETRDQPNAIEHLPFVIRCVRDEAELEKAVAIRQSAYGRHLPELAARFSRPEPSDLDGSSRVMVALALLVLPLVWFATSWPLQVTLFVVALAIYAALLLGTRVVTVAELVALGRSIRAPRVLD